MARKYKQVQEEYQKVLGHGDKLVCKEWPTKKKKTKKNKKIKEIKEDKTGMNQSQCKKNMVLDICNTL